MSIPTLLDSEKAVTSLPLIEDDRDVLFRDEFVFRWQRGRSLFGRMPADARSLAQPVTWFCSDQRWMALVAFLVRPTSLYKYNAL